jgi:hypothetical protein
VGIRGYAGIRGYRGYCINSPEIFNTNLSFKDKIYMAL